MTITKKVNIVTDIRGNVLDDDHELNEIVEDIFKLNGLTNIYFYANTKTFLAETDENVHLCMIDLNTDEGKLAGLSTARIIRKNYPKCKIILTSFTPLREVYETMINEIKVNGFVNKESKTYEDDVVKIVQENISDIKDSLRFAQLLEEDKENRKPRRISENSNV